MNVFNSCKSNFSIFIPPKWLVVVLVFCFSLNVLAATERAGATASPIVNQQQTPVSGIVTDATGTPLPGVNISVKGTATGVITDADGKYAISVPRGAVLEFSYLGFVSQSITVTTQTSLNVTLREDTQTIDEVVVIGYGTQKKVNLTGAVSAMQVDETLSGRALDNVASGLQGMLPGLAVSQNSSMAGREDVSLMIRGMGTVNNANPLIVVDGMPDVNINRLNMNDIESISVLKDAASAAIYGSRAANGVILITTKTGKGSDKVALNFSGNYALSYPTNSIEFMADYPRALTLHQRLAAVNTLPSNYQFKNGTIDQWMALGMIDPTKYPNTDWWDWIMRDNGALQTYNVSASGGNEKSNFFASIGVQDQEGLQVNNDYTRYNARFNFDYKLKNNLNVGVRFSGNWTKRTYYLSGGYTDTDDGNNTGGYDLQYAIAGITPYDPETGYYGGVMAYGEDAQAYNPYTYMVNNLNYQNRQEALTNMYLDWTPIKGLTARVEYSLNYYNQFRYTANTPNRAYNFQVGTYGSRVYVGEDAGVGNYTDTGYKTQLHGRLNYNLTVAPGHDIAVMAAYNEEYWYNRSQSTSRNNRLHPSLTEIDAALTDVQGTGGNSNTEGLLSYIGRLNYTAYEKYLLEINFRADGSSRFLPGHQYGFFPSAALGWRFSEEGFIKKLTGEWLHLGKLRLSYGTLGNNDVSRYEQKETLTASNYMMGSTIVKGFVNKKMINQNLSWETGAVTNVGLDLGFFRGKLSAELDYYDRLTSGMIRPSQMSIHLTGAYSAPRNNIGDMRNRGIELNLTWRDKKGDFNYLVNANFSRNWTQLEEWNEFLDKGWIYVNMPYRFVYTYQDLGIAQTWEDVYSNTPQGASPGDVLRKDVNGDGRIDANDKIALTGYLRDRPTTNFALNANASWKGIDLAVMLQGATGRKTFWINNYNNVNFGAQRYASSWEHWTQPWSWENRDGEWPRLGGSNNREESTFWLDDLSYLRLKNVQLGYSLPAKWLKSFHVANFRIYFSGENIATLTAFRGIDPERGGRGNSGGNASDVYPLVKSYSIGVNIGF
ncbi:MAG: TonB-dependent receptor [Tannerellaceae bacterium]|jgi:TonB-linked SusC/RagA family outer membrane protein|nr:TonB-dependent receptor [Tannerellaceae bacterium]